MSQKARFRRPLHEQDGKRSQTLLKSARQDLYHIYWWLLNKLKGKNLSYIDVKF